MSLLLITLSLKSVSNDQYRDGHVSVFDYWSRKPTCPVGIIERISSLLPDSGGSSYPIVCRVVNSRHSKASLV